MRTKSTSKGGPAWPEARVEWGPAERAVGYTLLELVAVLTLLAVGAAAAVPSVRRFADEASVMAARERVTRTLLRGRTAAVQVGGSVVTIVASPATARVSAAGTVLHEVPLGDRRTTVHLPSGRDSLTLRFDALGLGRFTSATIALRRGEADAALVLSSYGRVRRR
ncbi:MAG: prepilin-type N-terminal cleavage/methylation domain-containing protein [Gemmatimonadetes bacterium]|nr:prepilin-type N-terminal cleavage/methylation domain-containing protein [Gemmatimonadota bacterium]